MCSLYDYGLRGYLPIFVKNFLSNKAVRVRVGPSLSNSYPVHEGILQGTVLSCTCFLIAINGLTSYVPSGLKSLIYGDDLAIYASGCNVSAIQRRLQVAINAFE